MPKFLHISIEFLLPVAVLPEEGPRIEGGRRRYHVGDTVKLKCRSGRSKPAAQLQWYINGDLADSRFLKGPTIYATGREGLETAVLELEFVVRAKDFIGGDMKLKCSATISTLYGKSNEASVQGPQPQKESVMESRGTVSPPSSRADKVQCKL